MAVSSDYPEFVILAQLAGIDAEKMASAFNDPVNFFSHVSLEELERLKESCGRFAVLQKEMVAAMDVYAAYGKGLLEGLAKVEEPANAS